MDELCHQHDFKVFIRKTKIFSESEKLSKNRRIVVIFCFVSVFQFSCCTMSLVAFIFTIIISLIYGQSLQSGETTSCDCTTWHGQTINYSLLIPAWPDTPAESFLILTTSSNIFNEQFPVSASTGMNREGKGRWNEAKTKMEAMELTQLRGDF